MRKGIGSVLHGMRAFCCQFAAPMAPTPAAGELAAVSAVFGVLGCQFGTGVDDRGC